MKALRLEETLSLDPGFPDPNRPGEALVRVVQAGICGTDLEILKGYAGFKGVLGHEFVGRVVNAPDRRLIGHRVAGDINAGCGACELCATGDSRHCANRTVLGIKGRSGAFAEFLSLPVQNLLDVPDSLSDDDGVFIEPVAAACEILDQVDIGPGSRVAVIGDGKLAQLIVRVLATTGCSLTVIGKHEDKLGLAAGAGARTVRIEPGAGASSLGGLGPFDFVVEASGSASGVELALALVRPRGTIVLKSTHHDRTLLDLSQVVVNEVTLVGSRCGRFDRAIQLMAARKVRVDDLISGRFPLAQWEQAFKKAAQPSSLKVIIRMGSE